MLRNSVVVVDLNDKEIKTEEKSIAHSKPILHRAFSIFIYNDNNELLLQKRSPTKYHTPNLWSNACCSHPQLGENIIESAKERLLDEMGFQTDLEEIFSFIYNHQFDENLYEYEYDHVLIGKYNGTINFNKEEVCDTKWINLEKLKQDLSHSCQKYTPWFLVCAPRVIEYLEKKIG